VAIRGVVAELRRGGAVVGQPALGVDSVQVPVEPAAAGQVEAGLDALAERRVEIAVARRVVVGVVHYQRPANTRRLAVGAVTRSELRPHGLQQEGSAGEEEQSDAAERAGQVDATGHRCNL